MNLSLLIKKPIENAGAELARAPQSSDIILEIRDVIGQIDVVNSLFNMTSDPDMIERYIHELQALESYYNFLLKKAKNNSTTCPTAMMCPKMEREV